MSVKRYVVVTVTAAALGACEPNVFEPEDTTLYIEPEWWNDDTALPIRYYAVILDDSAQFASHRSDGGDPCATSPSKAHGADIDAVELLDVDGVTVLDTLVHLYFVAGETCADNAFDDLEAAKGAPDGDLDSGFVSLAGGSLTGEFGASSLEILEGYSLRIYEIDDAFCVGVPSCVGSEGYSVYVATERECTKDDADCEPELITDESRGSSTIVLPVL